MLYYFSTISTILLNFLITYLFIKKENSSFVLGFFTVIFVYIIISLIFTAICKIILNYNKHFTKINFTYKTKNTFNKKINFVIYIEIILYLLFSLIVYIKPYIFSKIITSSGIYNSFTYISKKYFLSLPFLIFETIFFEYCNIIEKQNLIIKINFFKLLLYLIFSFILQLFGGLTYFLYSKFTIDIFILPYYIIEIRKLKLLLCERRTNE